jgi:asparagine synthase (glutamine-hydrolysing)
MCGFAGILQKEPVPDNILESLAASIIHRGPDHTGYFKDEHAGFIHNRLSLVDLSTNAHQPFLDEDHVLLFNGEIYNHQELRNKMLPGQTFRSTSDTETLFHLLAKYGVEATCRAIHGMFAFAWYERETSKLSIVRDRIGIKPLFYHASDTAFVFSSEMKGIVMHFPLNINKPTVMSAAIGELENSRTHTAFESLTQLLPGHILTYDYATGKLETSRFFGLADLVDEQYYKELHGLPEKELLDEFDRLLNASVESMLMSDVGMGAFVSGGIDSSLITTMASRHQQIQMFTANIVGKYSELPFSRMLSERIGQPLHVYDFEPGFLIRDIVRTTWYYESPIVVHLNSIPFQGVARMANEARTKAVLTGEGADELFLGYPRLLTRKWDRLINLPFDLTTGVYRRIPGLTRYLNLNKANHGGDLLRMPYAFENEAMAEEHHQAFSFVKDPGLRKDHVLTLGMLGRGLHSLLWRNDRMGMMHSLESRFPFLDEDLLRFAVNTPIRAKIGRTSRFHNYKHPFLVDKYIVRKTAEKYLPAALNNREKKGFPLFGIANLKVGKGFFRDGFLQELYQMDSKGCKLMEDKTDPYLLAKMACVEIWGRLFARRESIEQVEERATSLLRMETGA